MNNEVKISNFGFGGDFLDERRLDERRVDEGFVGAAAIESGGFFLLLFPWGLEERVDERSLDDGFAGAATIDSGGFFLLLTSPSECFDPFPLHEMMGSTNL